MVIHFFKQVYKGVMSIHRGGIIIGSVAMMMVALVVTISMFADSNREGSLSVPATYVIVTTTTREPAHWTLAYNPLVPTVYILMGFC